MYSFRQKVKKFVTFVALLSMLGQSFSPYLFNVLPRAAYAQEVTPTDSPTPTDSVAPTPTPIDTITPTDVPTVTPTEVPTVTPEVTPEVTPSPTDVPINDQPSNDNSNSSNSSQNASSVTPTTDVSTPTPVVSPAGQDKKTGKEQVGFTILKDTSVHMLDLQYANLQSSATLTTDKADYAPIDTAFITGTGLLPNAQYTLFVSSTDPPPVNFSTGVTSDNNGTFTYAYQLDGTYRPNYSVELKDSTGAVVASTTFTDDAGQIQSAFTVTPASGTTSTSFSGTVTWNDDKTDDNDGKPECSGSEPNNYHFKIVDNGTLDHNEWIPGTGTVLVGENVTCANSGNPEGQLNFDGTGSSQKHDGGIIARNFNLNSIGTHNVCFVLIDATHSSDTDNITSCKSVTVSTSLPWPTNWTTPGACIADPANDENPSSTDIIGDGSNPAVGFASDANYQYFRERLNGNPAGSGGFDQFAWVTLFQTSTPQYQYLGSLNGLDEKVQLYQNTSPAGSVDFSPLLNDPAETLVWEGSAADYARIVNESGAYYAEWAIPLTELTSRGITTSTTKFFATSANANNFNKDHLNCYEAPATGTITVTKKIDADGNPNTTGDQTVASGWIFNVGGQAGKVTDVNGQTPPVTLTPAAGYDIAETQQAGYSLLAASCTGATSAGWTNLGDNTINDITVGANDIVSCTFINTHDIAPKGTIEIKKIISPADTSTFWNFGIDAGSILWDTWKTNGYSSGQIEVTPGNHSVVEQTAPGTDGTKYSSTLICKNGDTTVATGGPAALVYGQNLVSSDFNVAADQHIVCTFTNTKKGTIEIKKIISPSDTTNWNFGIDGGYTLWDTGKTDGYTSGQVGVVPGTHSVVEQVGYNGEPINGFTDGSKYSSTLVCKDGDTVVATGGPASLVYGENLVSTNFNVASDQHIICTFTNTKMGSIEIKKVISPADTTNWNFGIDAGYTLWDTWKTNGYDSGQVNVVPGQHSVVEQTAPGTDGTKYSSTLICKDDETTVATGGPASLVYGENLVSTNFNVASDQHITCTFTNTKYGSIQGRKYKDVNGNGIFDESEKIDANRLDGWTINLYQDDGLIKSMVTGNDTTEAGAVEKGQYKFINLLPGTYDLCEVSQTGWVQTEPASGIQNSENTYCHSVTISAGQNLESIQFGNAPLTDIHGYKWDDVNGNGERDCTLVLLDLPFDEIPSDFGCEPLLGGWTINLYKYDGEEEKWVWQDDYVTEDDGDHLGWYWFLNLLPGEYKTCEVLQEGWDQTYPNEDGCHYFSLPNNQAQTVNAVSGSEYDFGNQQQNPILTISKSNNAVGDKAPGDTVGFTLTITATQSAAQNVTVTDLLPQGFHFDSGSWKVVSNIHGDITSTLTAPTYHSPGVWTLGSLANGETLTLTYTADIDGGQNPGLYKDVAWAQGTSPASTNVLASAEPTGFVDTNFVGTDVNVVKDQQSGVSIAINNQQGEVLGISTLPGTGAHTIWVEIALSSMFLGLTFATIGLIIRKRYV